MLGELNLSNSEVFKNDLLPELKQKTFVYGKNGTGKSTVAKLIKEQGENIHDVLVFSGFESVVGTDRQLNAIALGIENKELQPKIDIARKEVVDLEKKVNPDISSSEGSKKIEAETEHSRARNQLSKYEKQAAADLKHSHQDVITNIGYDVRNFRSDVKKAQKLDADSVQKLYTEIAQHVLPNVKFTTVPEISANKYLQSVTEILEESVTETIAIKFNSDKQRNWVREGLNLHVDEDERCGFCGAILAQNRVDELNSYFNDEVKKLENRIEKGINMIRLEIQKYKALDEWNPNVFYPKFKDSVHEVNSKLATQKQKTIEFFEALIMHLEQKQNNIFLVYVPELPEYKGDWEIFNVWMENLVQENNDYGSKLNGIIDDAKNKLKLHLIFEKTNDEAYKEYIKAVKETEVVLTQRKLDLDKTLKLLTTQREKLAQLVSQTKDESIAAMKINEKLQSMGNKSITLVIDGFGNNGTYRIENASGQRRNISELSTGELNLVSFLYFILNLDKPVNGNRKPRIIVFDDPMTSNDDTAQYLIIMELQRLLKQIDQMDQIFILTHNTHFYSNIRFRWWNGQSTKKSTIHLRKSDEKTECVLISSEKEDISTSYEGLWKELEWLYVNDKPEYMYNTIRRIFETFARFQGINVAEFYSVEIDIKKMLDVNSHSIDDFEIDYHALDRGTVMRKVRSVFNCNGSLDHFDKHWNLEI